jgi:hypothetical protein
MCWDHWHEECFGLRTYFSRHLLGFVLKSGGPRAEVSDGLRGFAGLVVVLFGSQCVMKLEAGIAIWALGEHELIAHRPGFYTRVWRLITVQ